MRLTHQSLLTLKKKKVLTFFNNKKPYLDFVKNDLKNKLLKELLHHEYVQMMCCRFNENNRLQKHLYNKYKTPKKFRNNFIGKYMFLRIQQNNKINSSSQRRICDGAAYVKHIHGASILHSMTAGVVRNASQLLSTISLASCSLKLALQKHYHML